MSSSERIAALLGLFVTSIICAWVDAGDVMVQLHVNRPFNDVNEKFVSFTIRPEELYKALDGPNRKSMTRMAAMLGDSYVKFVGDYYFAASSETILRNPTKVIWRGFNRWSRAVNWTMIIPVPYSPSSWDPMVALKILNTSHTIGITNCIWQLGTDYSSSKAQEYVAELNTLNLMVDSFKPYVENWKVMGADISAGSSAEETRRYVEISKDINEAYGWTQPAEFAPSNRISSSYIYDRDPALRMLLSKKVPVWLSLPQRNTRPRSSSNRNTGEEISNAFRWAQTLGEAASSGFDAVFKKISITELERPSYSFYVTALYKKVMGSRVFPARPLNVFSKTNKLYTHCANDVSGGIAFMVVNNDERSMQITVRSMTKFAGTELWQYSLTQKKNIVLLNNERLALNSTLSPQVKIISPDQSVQLTTPGMSVSFWVLPNVNLEHCQYTEVEAEEVGTESSEKLVEKRYTSTDRLLKKLIQETSLTNSVFSRAINRRRRYATFADRPKRFTVNESEKANDFNVGLKKFFEAPAAPDPVEKTVKKREEETPQNVRDTPQSMREAALSWLKQFVPSAVQADLPLLKREARSIDDDFFGPFFATRDGRKTAFTRKITEIKKPEKKVKPIFDQEEFDEEEFFKNIGEQQEPEYTRLPEGDVHLKHITNTDGDDVEDFQIEKRKPTKKDSNIPKPVESKETKSEMKPFRFLPTVFYEAQPQKNSFTTGVEKLGIGNALNSLLFPEPFSKQSTKDKKISGKQKEEKQNSDSTPDLEDPDPEKLPQGTQLAKDFLKAQKELSRAFLNHDLNDDEERKVDDLLGDISENSQKHVSTDDKTKRYSDYFVENIENYFGDKEEFDEDKDVKNTESVNEQYKEVPWWDLGLFGRKRFPRALRINIPDEAWQNNLIDKDDDILNNIAFAENDNNLLMRENSIADFTTKQNDIQVAPTTENNFPDKLVAKVKQKVSSFMDIMSKHINDWYNTLTKHMEVDSETK